MYFNLSEVQRAEAHDCAIPHVQTTNWAEIELGLSETLQNIIRNKQIEVAYLQANLQLLCWILYDETLQIDKINQKQVVFEVW